MSLTESRLSLLLTSLDSPNNLSAAELHEIQREALIHIRNLTAEIVRRKSKVPILGQAAAEAGRSSSSASSGSSAAADVAADKVSSDAKRGVGKGTGGGGKGKAEAEGAQESPGGAEKERLQGLLEEADKECQDIQSKVGKWVFRTW